jgi:hypothetical protein
MLSFPKKHFTRGPELTRLSASEQLLSQVRIYEDSEPRTRISYGSDRNSAFVGTKTVIDDWDNRRFAGARSAADHVDAADFEANSPGLEPGAPRPQYDFPNLELHARTPLSMPIQLRKQ